ncbi:MAG: hypothetical protein JXQ73_12300 [Phycisphaerae bacterium]|nr:hypothetical protein [Phycisphaerae bacterium]
MRSPTSKAWLSVLAACTIGLAPSVVSGVEPSSRPTDRGRPVVILAHDETGDFGPQTPGTKTAGWQEALDHAVRHAADLYVKGGYGGRKAIYHIDDTIRIPPAQDFRIDGGVYVINFRGKDPSADAVVIDSAMNCEYRFGIIVYGGTGAGLRIRPERPVPIDGFPVVVETQIHSQGIADPRPFTPGERKDGSGLVLDAGKAGICYSKLYFASILNFRTCIEIGPAGSVYANELVCEHLHTNSHNGTLTRIGPAARQNSFRFGIGVDQGATGVTGIDVSASRNVFDVATRPGGFAKASQLILRDNAEGNQINLRTGEDPRTLITDEASTPTNQVTWTGPPAPIRRIEGNAGSFSYVQRLFPATVTVVEGNVTSVIFERAGQRVDYGPARGREIVMSVADRLSVQSRDVPALRIIPLKVR